MGSASQYLILLTIFIAIQCITTLRHASAIIYENGTCLSAETVKATASPIVRNILDDNSGVWRLVISLNMSDPLQDCPSGWSLQNSPRSCTQTTGSGCSLATFAVKNSYSEVRGRAVGIPYGSNDAFASYSPYRGGFNYADGMNIFLATATPQHVWTFAVNEEYSGLPWCPCSGTGIYSPDYVGSHYFCDTHGANNIEVWDGTGCSAATCCDFNNPPWFSVSFNTTYTQDIQVRLCTDENYNNERISLTELEIFVQ